MEARGPGGIRLDREEVRREAADMAQGILDLAATGYGPWGGHRLVVGGEGWMRCISPASALREARPDHPAIRPYLDLVAEVQRFAGDGGTLALLLAARLVDRLVDLPAAVVHDGLRLVRRQVHGVLASLAIPDPDGAALATTGPASWAPTVWAGLHELGRDGKVDLDMIHVLAEPRDGPAWSPGLIVEPRAAPRTGPLATGVGRRDARVLLVDRVVPRIRQEGVRHRIRNADGLDGVRAAEQALERRLRDRIRDLGVGLLVTPGPLNEDTAARIAQDVLVVADAPRSLLARLERATGAKRVPEVAMADVADLGRADLDRRPRHRGGWIVTGPGASATLLLPAELGRNEAMDAGERLLRSAGAHAADPRALPGGGRWQREVAASLRRAADAAPGRMPFVVQGAAYAFDRLADDLVRNAGRDPLETQLLEDAGAVLDPYHVVRLAVDAALGTAGLLLRLDGRYQKRPQTQEALRGRGAPETLRGLAGDVPPLM